ncbi:aldo/keto reductase [Streptomyces sp. 8L]|uniref:aldo/keto reductase n=1 Tax=Streptomyces sp. 8L TaxID=2877242 RepID=UPI001CD42E2F|nr:aldo/keto reductase [Streptomyces sp. 8L]MCA1223857.1 aldo/keto reductase [Streptomyces sp. 8L]
MSFESAAAAGTTRMGLGLAALGRPAYITLGRDAELPSVRTVEAMRERAFEVLDAAYENGVRYLDAARSYGRAEEFLAAWLAHRPEVRDVTVGSKWGYTYVGDWRLDADVHEVKDHSAGAFERQLAQTRALLGDRLDLYQVHSVTPESPVLTDRALQEELAALAAGGVTVGLSTSGPAQAEAIRAALALEVDGAPLFSTVQATYNLLETSAGTALAEAHEAGVAVIVKEALANGRLAGAGGLPPELNALAASTGSPVDAVALAAVLQQPWADVVLSGAVTAVDVISNLHAAGTALDGGQLASLASLAEPAADYWRHRSALPWT